MDVEHVPTTLVTGHLGAGKTTAIIQLMARRPEGERWAVLVNEFGKVGIDGALMEGEDYAVRQIPGGCVCCSAGPQLQIHLVRLLREQRPDRLIIEPTGLAMPGAIVDMLRRPGMRDAVSPRAVISLIDIRRATDERLTELDAFHAQTDAADVLVGTHADVATNEQLEAFRTWAASLWPPKLAVLEIADGALDPSWLDVDPTEREAEPRPHHHLHVDSLGWRYEVSAVFDRAKLVAALQALCHDHPAFPAGVMRLKAVFRTNRGWLLVQGTDMELKFRPFQHRRDSVIEWLVPEHPAADETSVRAVLEAARIR